jgi:cell wall-associated NlpC family hydrolase
MVNRIFWSVLITLALTFIPNPAHSIPTKSIKKKSSKTQARVVRKKKTSRKSKVSRSRASKRRSRRSRRVVRSSVVPSYRRTSVGETPPLMKVTPQRDGRFLLEPLTPKKTLKKPATHPAHKNIDNDRVSSVAPHYNTFEPWNFSDLVLSLAKSYRHAPYARGASLANSSATDCSGFVQFIYHGFKIDLPRSSAEQAQVGKVVTHRMDFSKLLPGDLLFFRRGRRSVGHAGIYLGEGKMIHASNYRNGVTVTDLRQSYYENTFVVAKRVFVVKYPQ